MDLPSLKNDITGSEPTVKILDKLLDLLVIDGFLLDNNNKLRMKIITINKNKY